MSNKVTLALALAAGFIGGIASQHIFPTPVHAQLQAQVPQEIRAHKFVLVDDAGVDRGVFGFSKWGAVVEVLDIRDHPWTLTWNGFRHAQLLPDATCTTCKRRPTKTGSPTAENNAPSK